MRRFIYPVLGMLLCLLTACSGESNVFQTKGVQWTEFQWVPAEIGGKLEEKAAIMLPLKIDGQNEGNLLMQLDTGCWSTVFYELPFQLIDKDAYRVKNTKDGRPLAVQYDGAIGTLPIKRGLAQIKQDYGTPYQQLQGDIYFGTVGLDMFAEHVLVLDFPNQRLCVLDSVSDLPAEIAANSSFAPAGWAQGWFAVEAVAAGRSLDLFFDTGSTPLIVTAELWQQLTGKAEEDQGVERFTGNSWGEQISLLEAPLLGEFSLGDFHAEDISVYQTTSFNQMFIQVGVDGLIGNALFYDEYVVILDLKEMRFGLAKLD